MSGLVKAKAYKVEDSNVEALGSKENKDAVANAGKTDPAWKLWASYLGSTQPSILKSTNNSAVVKDSQGIPHYVEIWRIEKFKVMFWPREFFGSFYSGDAYIILHCYQLKGENGADGKLAWDLHFWLGKDSTQDEQGTAAYKTVELDTILDDGPVQYRECQGEESTQFLKIFSDIYKCGGIRYMDGGIDSGFKHVEPEKYHPRLMHIKGKKKVRVSQVPLEVASLNSGDAFVLDMGLELYAWTGCKVGMSERTKVREVMDSYHAERRGKSKKFYLAEDDSKTHPDVLAFFKALGGSPDDRIKTAEEGGADDEEPKIDPGKKQLWRVSDASGSLKFTKESEGSAVKRSQLDPNDCFIFDSGSAIFTWVGKGATKQEKDNAMTFATTYMKDQGRPMSMPVTRILDGHETALFKNSFDA